MNSASNQPKYDNLKHHSCGASAYGRVVRVKNHADWRRFGPMERGMKQWKRLYKKIVEKNLTR